MVCYFEKDLQQKDPDLDHSAIRAKHLAVDPTAVWAGQERDCCRNVLRRAEALKRIHLRHAIDKFLRFSVEEQIRGGRSGRYGVYRNRPPAQFLRKDCRESFDGGFRRCVNAIGFELESDNTRGEVDDASAIAKAFGCLSQSVECSLQIDGNLPVEDRIIRRRHVRQQHDAGVVDQDVDSSEFLFRDFEHPRNLVRLADVSFRGNGASPRRLDLVDECSSFRFAACIVHNYRYAFFPYPFSDGRSYSARRPGDNCCSCPKFCFSSLFPDIPYIFVQSNEDRSAINHNRLPSSESFLHQKQIGLRDVVRFANSAHRQTVAHALIQVFLLCRTHGLPEARPNDSWRYSVNANRRQLNR